VVALDGQHIVSLAIHDLLRNALLTPHGVDGNYCTLEQEGIEQFRDRRDVITFVGRATCPGTTPSPQPYAETK
jgi:hypothetical protein